MAEDAIDDDLRRRVEEKLEAEGLEKVPARLWERLRTAPERAPEIIALTAVEVLAPSAAQWATSGWEGLDREERMRQVVSRHVALSRIEGFATGFGGFWTAAADLVALAWIQARMVMYIAAASGQDMTSMERAAELLVIQGLDDDTDGAMEALIGTGELLAKRAISSSSSSRDDMIPRLLVAVSKYAGKKALFKLVPVLSAPFSAYDNGKATSEIGTRALAFYR